MEEFHIHGVLILNRIVIIFEGIYHFEFKLSVIMANGDFSLFRISLAQ